MVTQIYEGRDIFHFKLSGIIRYTGDKRITYKYTLTNALTLLMEQMFFTNGKTFSCKVNS